nr:unnamed protein product [Callosobruchus analis]
MLPSLASSTNEGPSRRYCHRLHVIPR